MSRVIPLVLRVNEDGEDVPRERQKRQKPKRNAENKAKNRARNNVKDSQRRGASAMTEIDRD